MGRAQHFFLFKQVMTINKILVMYSAIEATLSEKKVLIQKRKYCMSNSTQP